MFKTAQQWWTALKEWATGTRGTAAREAVEATLTGPRMRGFWARQFAHLHTGGRGRFAQILRGGGIPADRPDQVAFTHGLPAELDFEIHEWENSVNKGFILYAYTADGLSRLRIDSDENSDWAWEDIT